MKRILAVLLTLSICIISWAQNLDKMNEIERAKTLFRIAKEGVMNYGPDYYREYGQPEIEHGYLVSANSVFSEEQAIENKNRSYYTVKYYYDKTQESFYEAYSAWVFIWGDTGEAFQIFFGNGLGLGVDDPDSPETRIGSKKIKPMTWKRQPPGYYRFDRISKE